MVCVSSTGTRCKVVLCSLEGKAAGERTAFFNYVFVSCCGVVVCVLSTRTRCKVVSCLLEGKAFGERTANSILFSFLAVVWWFVCGPQAPDVK